MPSPKPAIEKISPTLLQESLFPSLAIYIKNMPTNLHQRYKDRFAEIFQELRNALEEDCIRNVVYKEAKQTLNYFLKSFWRSERDVRFKVIGAWSEFDTPPTLHTLPRLIKKLEAADPKIQAAIGGFYTEILPLAQAMAYLKDKTVKGPAVAPPKPINPNKVIRTCPCCFREIAVVRNRMAIHGYRRTQYFYSDGSCIGMKYQPLERSNEGLIEIIRIYAYGLEQAKIKRGALEKATTLVWPVSITQNRDLKTIDKDSPLWERAFDSHKRALDQEISGREFDLKVCQKRLASWVQTEF